jgi:hypothetical protein
MVCGSRVSVIILTRNETDGVRNFICVPRLRREAAPESIETSRRQVAAKSVRGWSGVREGDIAAERPLAQPPHLHNTTH